ncbi:MAG: monovalent cation:proton antiporter-2 (CPA2) family protein [Paracoccaceae bacterium]|nr:MAG: monovalent cation:proton antiporter-2 (CPA2) family protein [Paracoccaceae bacterium]
MATDAATDAAHAAAHGPDIASAVILLAAAVIAVPLFKRLGLGSVLGYLAAGLAIGPFGLALFADPMTILHVAELGVVMFLFIIGLEMEPGKLWAMRGDIFGLGLVQVVLCMGLLSVVGVALGYPFATALIAGTGFVLTSTAIVMQMLGERGDLTAPKGQRIIAILLFEDLAIVPLLALAAFLAPGAAEVTMTERLTGIAIGLGAIAALVVAGRYLLNPFFGLLAAARAREVMTAAALLIVLGAALWMQTGGLSTAMGAFLAGVLLSESSWRHQLEADIEPFRGILLGLFFLAVGMSLDLSVVAAEWRIILISVVAFTALKMAGIYAVARFFRASHPEAVERVVLMAQGGEFAFVLYGAALAVGLLTPEGSAMLTAIIIVSMVMTPLFVMLHDRLMPRTRASAEGLAGPEDEGAHVLIVGFGRFGQIVSQPLLARGYAVSTIDSDPEMITAARSFGFKVFYGDGTRLDILHAAGAGHARAVVIAVDRAADATRIAHLMHDEFPLVPVLARAYDRGHAIELVHAGAAFQMRETFESALATGAEALRSLGEAPETVTEVLQDVRRRDAERLSLQMTGDIYAGRDLLLGNQSSAASAHH